ncbi:flagellar biosynthesis anti-sigma factor FlgM [Curvibacter sp. CHRR-16]|uniref:flagellar biosynthesis anti-sigma factor FlgM n=1 Tax=Curvibacter sp. CHRR-16 TaxID=2835872 RepID=UPI001BD9CD82|nr:flagellar biosynthesis anti-sigma factor FlgM [Curvibacter sp. CHRR-16]MBT0569544.1 flagellar biosynthesis anti-sigma factor FlgM [Curvibacter sp. CHRR-16]
MKIGQPTDISSAVPSSTASAGQKTAQGTAASAAATQAKQTAASPGVAVTMSSNAKSMEKTGDGAEIDQKKVAQMKQSIKDGSFKANPDAIADKMLSNAQEMMDRGNQPLN